MRTNIKLFFTAVFLAGSIFAWAQQKTITGKITDSDGFPVADAYVYVEGTDNGVYTDANGNYSLSVNEGDTVAVEFIGFETTTVAVGDSNSYNVSIARGGSIDLGATVATALGIEREKKALGYATVEISGEDLTEVTNANPFESLSGKVPGVDISAPLQPGASPKVINRGFSSLVNNSPLLVIDGTPTLDVSSSSIGFDNTFDAGTTFSDLDPNNIESMSFLKGAAATALYGSRGANGVIIVTTKKGKNRLRVDLSSAVSVSEVARVPHIQYMFGQGWSGLGYSNVSGEGSNAASNENGSWGPRFNGDTRAWGRIVNGAQQIKPYIGLEDNIRNFYNNGMDFTNSATISGGGDRVDASLSLTNTIADGVYPTDQDKFIRNNFAFNGGLNYDRFKIRLSANYVHKKQNAVPTGQGDDASFGKSLFQELLQMPNDLSITDMEDQSFIFNTPSYFFTPYASNPYVTLANNNVRIKKDRFYGNINFAYDINSDLIASFQFGGDIDNEYVKRWGKIVDYVPGSPQDLAGANGVVGAVREYQRQSRLYDSYFNLNYTPEISEVFSVNALAGVGYTERNGNSLQATVTDLDLPNFYELSNSAASPALVQNDFKDRYYYIFGQTELGYMDRVFLTLTARNDWSSALPVENNSYFYPAASLSGVILENNNQFLKARASWAQAGNTAPIYNVFATAGQAVNDGSFGQLTYPFGGINAYEIFGQIENQNLKNELTTEMEFGLEGTLFNRRVGFDLTYYNRYTEDMLLALPVSRSTGYSTIFGNFADVRNQGIEAMLNVTPIKNNDFRWDLTYTFTKNDGIVEEVANDSEITISSAYNITYKFVEGEDIGSFYAVVPRTTADGQYIVNSSTGFYETTAEEQKIGTSERDFVMGLINKLSYKNLSLSFAFDWKKGGEMYSYTKRLSHFVGNGIETIYNERNPFIIPNSVNEVTDDGGNVSYVENTTPVGFEAVTNFWNVGNNPGIEYLHVIDKSFLRMRDISLTYDLPSDWFSATGIKGISFTAYGKNLFLWTPAENPYVDPESTTYGTDITSEFGEFAANPTQRFVGGIFRISL